jgi:hypothetical protein
LADIDANFANIFSSMMTTDIEIGTAVYQAFNGVEARRLALFKAAEKALPEWQLIILRAVWNITKAARDQRDKFAHHAWGYSRDIPDALLLMNPGVVVEADTPSWIVKLSIFSLGTAANEVGRRQLLNEPRFQQAIEPLIQEKSSEVQAQLRPPGDGPPPKGTWPTPQSSQELIAQSYIAPTKP